MKTLLFILLTALPANAMWPTCGATLAERVLTVAGWEVVEETAAEAELPLQELLPQLETDTGTVGPVFIDGVAPPRWLTRKFTDAGYWTSFLPWKRERETLSQLPWSMLSLDEQFRLIVDSHRYLTSRDVGHLPGLRFQSRADDWASAFLNPRLGYVYDFTNPTWGEAHLRGPLTPGQAREAMFRLFPTSPSVHVHCPVPLAFPRLMEEGLLGAAVRTDQVLRANAFAEMMSVLYRGTGLRTCPRQVLFGGSAPLCHDGVGQMALYFMLLSHGQPPNFEFPWLMKNAFVGLREDRTYDRAHVRRQAQSDAGAFVFVGLEHRFLRRGKAGRYGEFPAEVLPLIDQFMTATRDQMRLGVDEERRARVYRWAAPALHQTNAEEALFALAQDSWYRGHTTEHGTDDEMVRFDWAQTPLLLGEPQRQRRWAEARQTALRELQKADSITPALRRFIWHSGLFHALAASFHIPESALPPPNLPPSPF